MKGGSNYKTPEELLYYFLCDNLIKHNSNGGKATYENKECTIIQTTEGRLRSFDDVYIVARTYFPDITIREVALILFKFRPRGFFPQLYHCSTMARIRIVYVPHFQILNTEQFNSKYSWEDILKIAGIKNKKDILKLDPIVIGDTSTYVYTPKDSYDKPAIETTSNVLTAKLGRRKVTIENKGKPSCTISIGDTKLTITQLKGLVKRFESFRYGNGKDMLDITGHVTIQGQKVTHDRLINLYNSLI